MEAKMTLHEQGACKPCAYFHYKEDGCRNAEACEFCHLCAPGELKERKKQKYQKMKAMVKSDKLAARQGRNQRGQKQFGLSFPPDRKAALVKQDKSDDETTNVPSETESNDTVPWAAPIGPGTLKSAGVLPFAPPPGLERPSLPTMIAEHSLPLGACVDNKIIYSSLQHNLQPAYVKAHALRALDPEAVSVSFMRL